MFYIPTCSGPLDKLSLHQTAGNQGKMEEDINISRHVIGIQVRVTSLSFGKTHDNNRVSKISPRAKTY